MVVTMDDGNGVTALVLPVLTACLRRWLSSLAGTDRYNADITTDAHIYPASFCKIGNLKSFFLHHFIQPLEMLLHALHLVPFSVCFPFDSLVTLFTMLPMVHH